MDVFAPICAEESSPPGQSEACFHARWEMAGRAAWLMEVTESCWGQGVCALNFEAMTLLSDPGHGLSVESRVVPMR